MSENQNIFLSLTFVLIIHNMYIRGFAKFGIKSTVYGVLEGLTFKISEGSDQNWCFPGSALLAVSAKLVNQLVYILSPLLKSVTYLIFALECT